MIIRALFILRRRWPIIILLPLLAGGLGLLFTPTGAASSEPSYRSQAFVAVNQQAIDQTAVQQALIESVQGPVAEATATALGGGTSAEQVSNSVSADFEPESYVVTLRASSADRDRAGDLAQAFASSFVEVNNADATSAEQSRIDAATQARDDARGDLLTFLSVNEAALNGPTPGTSLQLQLEQLQNALNTEEANLSTVQASSEQATIYRLINVEAPTIERSTKLELPASRLLRVTLGVLLGMIGAAAVVAVIERLNPRIDDPLQAAELIGAPVLAMVPVVGRRSHKSIERADPDEFRGPFAEAFRSMRAHLDFRVTADGLEAPPRIIVTSATPAEGKSTSAAFLALAYAESERPPVVIGADLRRPSVHKIFDVERLPGLSSRATGGGSNIPLSEIVKRDPVTGVSVVPSGPAVDRITGVVNDLVAVAKAGQDAGRVVIIDTPPVMVANDATDFLLAADWVVVVVRVGRSTERSVKQMMATLNLNQAKVVGVVMVGSAESSDAKRYYYSYYSVESENRRNAKPVLASSEITMEGSIDEVGTVGTIPASEP